MCRIHNNEHAFTACPLYDDFRKRGEEKREDRRKKYLEAATKSDKTPRSNTSVPTPPSSTTPRKTGFALPISKSKHTEVDAQESDDDSDPDSVNTVELVAASVASHDITRAKKSVICTLHESAQPVACYADLGADDNLIDFTWYRDNLANLCDASGKHLFTPAKSDRSLIGANKSRLPLKGSIVILDFHIVAVPSSSFHIEFVLCENLAHKVIIGSPGMATMGWKAEAIGTGGLELRIEMAYRGSILNIPTTTKDKSYKSSDTASREICALSVDNPRVEKLWKATKTAHLPADQQVKLKEIISEYHPRFLLKGEEPPSTTSFLKHNIPIKPGSDTFRIPPRRIPPHVASIVQSQVDKWVECGTVEEITGTSTSFQSPLLIVKKRTEPGEEQKWRVCVDCRELNKRTEPSSFPIHNMLECIDRLQKGKLFTSLDMTQAFTQVEILPEHRKYTVFQAPNGRLYQFVRMPFGLITAPATFCELMTITFSHLGDFSVCYFDDIDVFTGDSHIGLSPSNEGYDSKLFALHWIHLRSVLARAVEANLFFGIEKTLFAMFETFFCGFVIRDGIRSIDKSRINPLLKFDIGAHNATISLVRSFIGCTNFFSDLIHNYAHIVEPLTALLRVGSAISKNQSRQLLKTWNDKCTSSVDTLKKKIASDDVFLALPDFDKQFILYTDASDVAIGGMLAQESSKKLIRPVAFYSKTLSSAERNYSVTDREGLAVIRCITKWRYYLLGKRFLLFVDHRALTFMYMKTHLTGRMARWVEQLSEFQFDVKHIEGKLNVVADLLSRPNESADQPALVIGLISSDDISEYEKQLIVAQKHDPFCQRIAQSIVDQSPDRDLKMFFRKSGLLMRKSKDEELENLVDETVVVPKIRREEIMSRFHDTLHSGRDDTIAKCRHSYWWPKLIKDLSNYVLSCPRCIAAKPSRSAGLPDGVYRPSMISTRPFENWHVDFMGPFNETNSGNLHVWAAVVSKWPIIIPVRHTTAETHTRLVLDEIIAGHGVPTRIFSDNAKAFRGDEVQRFYKIWNIQIRGGTAYRPQANGQVERLNAFIKNSLKTLAYDKPDDWDKFVSLITYAKRSMVSRSIGMSPFQAVYGFVPPSSDEVILKLNAASPNSPLAGSQALAWLNSEHLRILELINNKRQQEKDSRQEILNSTKFKMRFAVGDHVVLRLNTKTPHPNIENPAPRRNYKLCDVFSPPFVVEEILLPSSLRVKPLYRSGKQKWVNMENVKLYVPRSTPDSDINHQTHAKSVVSPVDDIDEFGISATQHAQAAAAVVDDEDSPDVLSISSEPATTQKCLQSENLPISVAFHRISGRRRHHSSLIRNIRRHFNDDADFGISVIMEMCIDTMSIANLKSSEPFYEDHFYSASDETSLRKQPPSTIWTILAMALSHIVEVISHSD